MLTSLPRVRFVMAEVPGLEESVRIARTHIHKLTRINNRKAFQLDDANKRIEHGEWCRALKRAQRRSPVISCIAGIVLAGHPAQWPSVPNGATAL
ncbi:hypothetical protein [Sansalvadorimonas verongulae]|uniref:hypothetical protein n=1 Tax=Sansalvadorimonas verongulae TaxID=2172824 RepID=UPI0012BB9798|nr:hypothetical protein [Sansalvadorimonas verongulae]MTI13379.1 hypothetical protein [Sansalvadorimonas verongulae]